MITIKNRTTEGVEFDDFPVHRGTILGNPYSHKDNSIYDVIKCSSREESIKKYEEYFYEKIKKNEPCFINELNQIIIKKLKGEDVNLLCFCSPKPCHAQVIKEFIENQKYVMNWFSNMRKFDEPYIIGDIEYKTVENLYQAYKTKDKDIRKHISKLNPYDAKLFARKIELRSDWEEIKMKVMYDALKYKFNKGTEWEKRLKSTGNSEIIEWNNWNDVYWGKDIFTNKGKNVLGKMIMKIRNNL